MKNQRCWIYLTAGIVDFLSILAGVMTFAQEVYKDQIQE
jgi:hypothetical protein